MKKLVWIFIFIFVNLFASSDFDKDIIVIEQSRDDKVKIVFNDLMQFYEEEDSHSFFNLVSEERFVQDYMTFNEAIDEDFRNYEIINVDKWIDKITSDGVKKYLYVRWEKRYETNSGNKELFQKGYSRFLFDEVNGEYKLIELAGNNLWGASLSDWKEEVGVIPHQEPETKLVINKDTGEEKVVENNDEESGLPDLIISDAYCEMPGSISGDIVVIIVNIGESATDGSTVAVISSQDMFGSLEYEGVIKVNDKVMLRASGSCDSYPTYPVLELDPDNMIAEEDDDNNSKSILY